MRIFFKTGSTVTELTEEIKRFGQGTKTISYSSGDYIYIASDFPFNHTYFKLGDNVNSQNVTLNVEYWSNSDWRSVVHLNDLTQAFSQSGFIEFTPDREGAWMMTSTNYGGNTIPDLASITVYDKYWSRISLTGNMDDVDFDWIGNLFSDDNDLYAEYPIFNDDNFLSCFKAGKTDWQEQHVRAADVIVKELKQKNIILGKEQILDRDIFMPASVVKVAEIIFNAFGRDYNDSREIARNEFKSRMDLSQFNVDINNNGDKEPFETVSRQGWISR